MELVSIAQSISEFAVLLHENTNSPKNIAGFNEAMNRFLTSSRKIVKNGGQDDLLQAGEVFLLSNKRSDEATITKFQRQAKKQLVIAIEEVLVGSTLHSFSKKIQKFNATGPHGGISKNAHNTIQYFQLLENEILADTTVRHLCNKIPEFKTVWEKEQSSRTNIVQTLGDLFPRHDALQYFNIEASKAYNSPAPELDLDLLAEKQPEDDTTDADTTETTQKDKKNEKDDKEEKDGSFQVSKSHKKSGSDTTNATPAPSKGRSREKRLSVATFSAKKLRTFLKKKPSIVDELMTEAISSGEDNAKKLNELSKLAESSADVYEMELETRTFKEPTIKIVPTVEDLPALIQSFNSSVFIIAELGSMFIYFFFLVFYFFFNYL